MAIVTVNEFINKYKVHVSEFSTNELSSYIDRYEKSILVNLFGLELYNLWDGSVLPKYADLTDPFIFQESCSVSSWGWYFDGCCLIGSFGDLVEMYQGIFESLGIKDMLLGFIYFEYQRDIYTQQTINGAVKNTGENSVPTSFEMANLHGRYASALSTYDAIQAYIIKNGVDYPEFKGVRRRTLNPIF